MSLNYAPSEVSTETYQRIFEDERRREYPMVDAYEARMRFAVDRARLEGAARVLSCPYKAADPCWQHGRVLYATARRYFEDHQCDGPFRALDIGTAKGFSALCVRWALEDTCVPGDSFSVDVMSPNARVRRNTVTEVTGLKTLYETLEPWPAAQRIQFVEATGIHWLEAHPERIHFAFVDGKHAGKVVKQEGLLLADRQQPCDMVIFDDVHIPDVGAAVQSLSHHYAIATLQVLPKRAYAIARRR